MEIDEGSTLRAGAGRLAAWVGTNAVPLALLPLAAVFVWVAVWRVWLPQPSGSSASSRSVTTVHANAGTRPTHKVTTVVKTAAASVPSRRSETLVLALVFLGAGIAVIAVFNNRIGSIELDKAGVKISLNPAEKAGAAELVDRLARSGAGSRTLARGLRRYLASVAARRPPPESPRPAGIDREAASPGLTTEQAQALAASIADDLV